MEEKDMDSKKSHPRPRGIFLVLIAGCLVAGMPFVTTYLGLRDFDVDPRVPRWQAIMSLPLFFFLVLPIIFIILFAIRRRCLHPLLRSVLVLAPALVLTMPGLIEALVSPEKPAAPFTKRMGHLIPSDASGLTPDPERRKRSQSMVFPQSGGIHIHVHLPLLGGINQIHARRQYLQTY
jgi:hypothetical protein